MKNEQKRQKRNRKDTSDEEPCMSPHARVRIKDTSLNRKRVPTVYVGHGMDMMDREGGKENEGTGE